MIRPARSTPRHVSPPAPEPGHPGTTWGGAHLARVALTLLLLVVAARAGQQFVYISAGAEGTNADQLHVLALDKKTGALTPADGSPFEGVGGQATCGGGCSVAVARHGKQTFLLTPASAGITVWALAEDGTPTPVEGSPFDTEGGVVLAGGVATQRVGKRVFVYSSSYARDELISWELLSDGTLVPLEDGVHPTGAGPDAVAAGKRIVAVACEDDGELSTFKVQKDGSLVAAGEPLPFGPVYAYNVRFDRRSRHAYVADLDASQVFAFSLDRKSGAATLVEGAPFETGLSSGAHAAEPIGARFVVVGAAYLEVEAELRVMKRAKGGTLLPLGEPLDSGLDSVATLAADRRGRWLLALDRYGNRVRCFRLEAKKGLLELADEADVVLEGIQSMIVVDP